MMMTNEEWIAWATRALDSGTPASKLVWESWPDDQEDAPGLAVEHGTFWLEVQPASGWDTEHEGQWRWVVTQEYDELLSGYAPDRKSAQASALFALAGIGNTSVQVDATQSMPQPEKDDTQ